MNGNCDMPNMDPFWRDAGGVPMGLAHTTPGAWAWLGTGLAGQILGWIVKGLFEL